VTELIYFDTSFVFLLLRDWVKHTLTKAEFDLIFGHDFADTLAASALAGLDHHGQTNTGNGFDALFDSLNIGSVVNFVGDFATRCL